VGRALYARLLPLLEAQGFRTVLAVLALPNPASAAFHETFGYRHVGTLADAGFKLSGWHDVGLWQRRLGADDGPCGTPRTMSEVTAVLDPGPDPAAPAGGGVHIGFRHG
jgi:phosphinothricin acetyltransferase